MNYIWFFIKHDAKSKFSTYAVFTHVFGDVKCCGCGCCIFFFHNPKYIKINIAIDADVISDFVATDI